MTGFDLLGWIVIGLLAGSISGWFVGTRSVQGCLPTIVVGILGAVVGGWLTRTLGNGPAEGFIGAGARAGDHRLDHRPHRAPRDRGRRPPLRPSRSGALVSEIAGMELE